MKKALIISGVLIALLFASFGVWAYLMYSGTTVADVEMPAAGNPFAAGEFRTDSADKAQTDTSFTPVTATNQTLRQLSTRKVIGAVLVPSDSGTTVRYAEAGTGHLYEVPLDGGSEMRISNTTFPRAKYAVWSRQGTRVVLISEKEGTEEAYLGALEKGDDGTTGLVGEVLPISSHSYGFSAAGDQFFYALRSNTGTTGFRRDLKMGKETAVFSVPLRDVTVSWEPAPLIVTRASGQLEGYAYSGDLSRVGQSGLALRAIGDSRGYALGGKTVDGLTGYLIGTTTISLDRGIAPDKCTFTSTQLVCAIPKDLNIEAFPDEWYRGQVSYNDTFYTFNRATGASTLVSDPIVETRREIDVASFEMSGSDGQLLFITKIDRTLWLLSL